ncbi:hypothetical protein GCM10010365_34630 [Streptomyces poonensis]|uniref:Uncharacterized protein n=1 Tax=Streptomyces poonensis TaxID=68255 RepID=A0A918PIK4_9ACTN|nr:hypothetical protein GCM10010365_34630 [Streptomyces poonensis]GLJ92622.1 hypothetical protein GCM10017589_52320 [Streptomyces poonensis]
MPCIGWLAVTSVLPPGIGSPSVWPAANRPRKPRTEEFLREALAMSVTALLLSVTN